MKWVVLGGKDQEIRFRCLSETLTTQGVKNDLEFSHPVMDGFFLELEKWTKQVDHIRLQSPYSAAVQDFENKSTGLVSLLGSADALLKKDQGEWWPENFLFEAFNFEFVKHVKQLDLNSHVLIVGSGAAARVVTAALIRLGFSRFYISDRFEERAKDAIESLKRNFFKVDFTFIAGANLMLLPGSSSVLVNATPLVPDNSLLKDLYYFNFLKHPALIADLNVIPLESPLLEEGRSLGAQIIAGYEVATKVDALWTKKALGVDLNIENYRELLKKKIMEVPFDVSPYRLS